MIPPEGKSLASVEREAVLAVLQITNGNRSAAARILGISRPTLTRKLREYGVAVGRLGAHRVTPRELAGLPPELAGFIGEALKVERAGRRSAARAMYERALYKLDRKEHAATASALLRWTGRTHADDADTEAAFDCYAAALAISMANGDRPGVASVINLMAIAQQQRGELDEAARLYKRAVKYATLADEPQLVVMIEQNLGTIADDPRRPADGAQALPRRARRLPAPRARERDVRGCSTTSACSTARCGAGARRRRCTTRPTRPRCSTGDGGTQIAVAVNRAELWIAQRDFTSARQWCDTALELAERTGDHAVARAMRTAIWA